MDGMDEDPRSDTIVSARAGTDRIGLSPQSISESWRSTPDGLGDRVAIRGVDDDQ